MSLDAVIYALDLAGIAVFAITGALAAMEKKLDIFGVLVLATITALGGGTIRDILMDKMPPFYFERWEYLVTALCAALLALFMQRALLRLWKPIILFDALGLGLFTVIGAEKALQSGYPFPAVLILAMLTGIGGGMLRDVLRGEIPFVLKKEIYASASLAGALAFYPAWNAPSIPESAAMLLGAGVTVFVRLISVKYKLGLPAVRGE